MQGKGIVKFFLVALTIVSIIQFMYILPTNRVENDADSYAESICITQEGNKKNDCVKVNRAAFLDSMSTEIVFRLPLLKSYTYQDLKSSQLNFGLDLKGG